MVGRLKNVRKANRKPTGMRKEAPVVPMCIDATNLILGRMSSLVAKLLRSNHAVTVVNCEKAVVSGQRLAILEHATTEREFGAVLVGPYITRRSDAFVKRCIRGMMPYKRPTGKVQFDRLKCYIGHPAEITAKAETLPKAAATRLTRVSCTTVGEIIKHLGGHQ